MKKLEATGRKGRFLMFVGPSENIVSVGQGNDYIDSVKSGECRGEVIDDDMLVVVRSRDRCKHQQCQQH